jgi:hypothetical protein
MTERTRLMWRAEALTGADADLATCFFLAMPDAASATEGRHNTAAMETSATEANLDKNNTSTSAHTVTKV